MKRKKAFILVAAMFSTTAVFCQDTSQNQKLSQNKNIQAPLSNSQVNPVENHTYYSNSPQYKNIPQYDNSIHAYRDTRLGSSSPEYNTYKKNDYGAGSITTNPNKGSGGGAPLPATDMGTGSQVPANTMQTNSNGVDTSTINKK